MADNPVTLTFSREERAAHLTLNRPTKNNALDRVLLETLADHIETVRGADDIRIVTVRGEGGTFSAGADLAELKGVIEDGDREAAASFLSLIHETFDDLAALPVPTVAVVEGFSLAGGLELLLACDLAVCSSEASIGDQHANYGLIAGGGGTQRLPAIVGSRRAKELIFTGRRLDAATAREWGLVNRVVDPADLDNEVDALVDDLAGKSADAAALAKELVHLSLDEDLKAGLTRERECVEEYMFGEDAREGLAAFAEGRKPEF